MKASVSTYCHCRDDDRPHRSAEWQHRARKERVGRPWRCIVNFKQTLLSSMVVVVVVRYSARVYCFPFTVWLKGSLHNITELLSSLSLSVAGRARVKLYFVWGGIQFPRDPVSEVRFCCQSLFSDRKWMIYTCITTKWQDTIYCMCVLVSVQRPAG